MSTEFADKVTTALETAALPAIGAEADANIDALSDANIVLTARAEDAESKLATAVQEHEATKLLLADTQQDLKVCRRNNTLLRQQLEECQNPTPAYDLSKSLGYCPDPNEPAEVLRLSAWSNGHVRRTYKSPGGWTGTPSFAGDAAAGLRTAHTCKGIGSTMKARLERLVSGVDDEAIIAYILKSQKDSILGTEHEPENDAPGRDLYRRGQIHFAGLVREANARDGGQRLVAGNLMSMTDTDEEIGAWYPGDGVWDILGFDGYNWPNRTAGSTTIPRWVEFEEIFAPDWENTLELGLQFAIFEFGCRKNDLLSQVSNNNLPSEEYAARQAEWCAKANTVMVETFKPVVATYFHHDWWLMRENGHRALGGQ